MKKDEIIEAIKASEAKFLAGKLAPVIEDVEKLIAMQIMSWTELAQEVGVSRVALYTAKKRAHELLKSWREAGIAPTPFAAPVVAPAAVVAAAAPARVAPAPVAAPAPSKRNILMEKFNNKEGEEDIESEEEIQLKAERRKRQ